MSSGKFRLASRAQHSMQCEAPGCARRAARAIYPSHIILGGNLHILLPAYLSMDGLEVGSSLTVVVHQEDERLVAESVRKTPDDLLGGQPH
jgi:hypothetical protein